MLGESRGRHRGRPGCGLLFLRTMHYSLRRALSLDSVDGCTHNPKGGGSNPPPATNPKLHSPNHLKSIAGTAPACNRYPLGPISRQRLKTCSVLLHHLGRGDDRHHQTVRGALPLRDCLGVAIHRALDGRVPEQLLLHLEIDVSSSQHFGIFLVIPIREWDDAQAVRSVGAVRDNSRRIAGDATGRAFFATPLASRYSKGGEFDRSISSFERENICRIKSPQCNETSHSPKSLANS
jgi:hypothetical protein